ncbi:MAG: dicarboxylate--CoA ligase PimA [Rhodospirillales bacterium]|nr:dicarboxylate--CoA ligase PimA [Rhodospirillales bacterium]
MSGTATAAEAERPWLAAYPPEIDWRAPLPERPLDWLLDQAVARFADHFCMDFLGRRTTYAELGALVARASKGLRGLGVTKGMRVGLFLPNTPYYPIFYYAILKAGGIVVNFNPLYAEREVGELLRDSGASIIVTIDLKLIYQSVARMLGSRGLRKIVVCAMADVLPTASGWLFRLFKRGDIAAWPRDASHIGFDALIDNDGVCDAVEIDPRRDIALLQYTGGTTGTPKGAMLTHYNLLANAVQSDRWFHRTVPGRERAMAVLPFFHVFAMTCVMNHSVVTGAEIVMLPRFDLLALLRTLVAKKVTIFAGVPTIFTAINIYKDIDKLDLSSIKLCVSGGAPLPLEVKKTFERLTGSVLVEGYGLSEASPVVVCNPVSGINKPGSVGLPYPGTTIEILSLDEPRQLLPTGERGEICVRGPQVMSGYWNNPEETARTLAGGRLHTGDVGYLDEEGYLFIVDRIKDVIIASGYKIFPRNVEEAIYLHPSIAECVVIGKPDPYRGQTVKAFVVMREGAVLTSDGLAQFLADKLSPMEMPKEIEFRASLPKTPIGKLSKKDLIEEEAVRSGAAQHADQR